MDETLPPPVTPNGVDLERARIGTPSRHEGGAWTIREIAYHVAESSYDADADAVGDLS
jgi:hypothetical protein